MKRRKFLQTTAVGTASMMFPHILLPKQKEVLGVALVGLGYYSRDLLAPALQMTRHCKFTGIVTGSPEKVTTFQKQYGIPDKNVYNYENMQGIANNPEIDVIYIVLPTGLHAEYAIIAANTGKHVWCEKPMARTEKECQAIIDACKKNRVKLSIGYRMQHEPNTQKIIEWATSKPFGEIRTVKAEAGYYDGRSSHWKLKKEMGGGAMYDMGVYTINAARYSTGLEPLSVTASHSTQRPEIYTEVDETTTCQLEFPGGIVAHCKTSFGQSMNDLTVTCEKGNYYLRPFQSYSGIKGQASNGTLLNQYIPNQQAKQMDDDALAILNQKEVLVPGEEGMKDIRIVEAIYRAAKTGKREMI